VLTVLMLCVGVATVACSSTFRFDDHSVSNDASGTADGATGADAMAERSVSCDAAACDFLGQPCSSSSCLLHCPHGKTCTGRCDSDCTADCEEDAICTLTTGEGADLECEPDARCSFIVGPAGRIECRTNSDCGTRCQGSCTLSCNSGATCALACGETQQLAAVSGTAGCP
jgi:hypothetical protein